jgi:hypothetical protein
MGAAPSNNNLTYEGKICARNAISSRDEVQKTDQEWRSQLSAQEYSVLRKKDTERPFTGKFNDCKDEGTYLCLGCDNALFRYFGTSYLHITHLLIQFQAQIRQV